MAFIAVRTGIGPADLLAAPASVYDEIVAIVAEQVQAEHEQARRMRHEERIASLRRSMGR